MPPRNLSHFLIGRPLQTADAPHQTIGKAIGLAVFAGLKADKWLHTSPLLVCALPLLLLFGIFYKLVKETARKDPSDKTTKR